MWGRNVLRAWGFDDSSGFRSRYRNSRALSAPSTVLTQLRLALDRLASRHATALRLATLAAPCVRSSRPATTRLVAGLAVRLRVVYLRYFVFWGHVENLRASLAAESQKTAVRPLEAPNVVRETERAIWRCAHGPPWENENFGEHRPRRALGQNSGKQEAHRTCGGRVSPRHSSRIVLAP